MEKFNLRAKRPLIISGPCSAETEEQTIETCKRLAATGKVDVLRAGIWKPRTKPGCFEGVGVEGLAWMVKAREITGLPIAVEVATAKHVEQALAHDVDILWIGARTTVNPFSVQEIADALKGTDKPILIKNPINPDIALWAGAVARLTNVGIDINNIGLIHRGFSHFGKSKYRNPPMWSLAVSMKSQFPDMPMICDPSHICGCSDLLLEVAQHAADLRFDGLIMESHICPSQALSDAAQQIVPEEMGELISSVKWRADSVDNSEYKIALKNSRDQIDQIDTQLFDLFSQRMEVSDKIGEIKRDNNVAILQGGRWSDIVEKTVEANKELLSEDFVRNILDNIHLESISRQNKIMNK